MAILFAGTSIADVYPSGTPTVNTTAAQINADMTEGINVNQSNFADIKLPTKQLDLWIAFDYFDASGTISSVASAFGEVVGFYDTATPAQRLFGVGMGYNSGVGSRIGYWNGTTFIHNAFTTGDLYGTARIRVDIHLKIADTGGVFELYSNGTLWASMGITDTQLVGTSGIDVIRLNKYSQGSNLGTYSAIIVADEDTRAMALASLPFTGAGGVSGWTGAYTDINENGYTDAGILTTATLDAIHTFVTTDLAAKYSTFNVKAVAIGARGIGGASSPTTIRGITRQSAVNYDKVPEMPTPAALGPINVVWNTNPATAAPWTYALVNSAEYGFKATA